MNANEAKRWIDYAEKDLSAASVLLDSGEFFPRQICFLAQQAAEKAIKAVLVFEELHIPVHKTLTLSEFVVNG